MRSHDEVTVEIVLGRKAGSQTNSRKQCSITPQGFSLRGDGVLLPARTNDCEGCKQVWSAEAQEAEEQAGRPHHRLQLMPHLRLLSLQIPLVMLPRLNPNRNLIHDRQPIPLDPVNLLRI